jgi:hypothetical protein
LGAVKSIRERGDGGRWIDGERERERGKRDNRERDRREKGSKRREHFPAPNAFWFL